MLVLSRKKDQTIVIDGKIKITVLKAGSRIKLGIEAPEGMRIEREELREIEQAINVEGVTL